MREAIRRAAAMVLPERSAVEPDPMAELLADGEKGAPRSREERQLIQNVLKLRDLRVDDVMVPRADIVAVEMSATLDDVLAAFRESAHSRLPVYRETLDDPAGVVHLKDLALSHGFGARANDFALADHVRSVLAVPPSMRVQALLERMQATRRHMALVIDEYGGVDGLVTIEDVIEQIVGAIEDEHDDAEGPLWVRQRDGAYLAEARAVVEDFETATGARLLVADWEDEIDTLGGIVFMLCGRVPERGEVIAHPLGHEFEIVDADPRRIKRLRIRISESGAAAAAASGAAAATGAATAAETPVERETHDADLLDPDRPEPDAPRTSEARAEQDGTEQDGAEDNGDEALAAGGSDASSNATEDSPEALPEDLPDEALTKRDVRADSDAAA